MRSHHLPLTILLITATAALAQQQQPKPRPNEADLQKINAALPETAPAKPKQKRTVLVFTRATGFVHSSIPVGAKCVELMGNKTGAYSTIISDDPESFAPEKLKDVDAIIMMSTTGSLFVPKGAKESLLYDPKAAELPADVKRAKDLRDSFLGFVKGGKGVVGFHAATDSSYQWKEYGEMMGGFFNGHPWGKITLHLDDPTNPVNAAFENKPFILSDEIYTFKTDPASYNRERLHILASIDIEASKIDSGFNRPKDHDYAVSWLNKYGEGRVFYSLIGHREESWWNPVVLKHFLAGIQFATGDLEADAKPSGPLAPERLAANMNLAARAWQKVSGDEKWYRDQKEPKEQTFSGVLEAIPNADGPSIIMRASFYKLGERTVFTGGKKHPVLDSFIGKKVDLRGKPVDMELEGRSLKEIWPASVRPAQ